MNYVRLFKTNCAREGQRTGPRAILAQVGMTGRMVKQFSLPESETGMQIDLSNLTSGVYTYKHTQDSVLLHSGKITKE